MYSNMNVDELVERAQESFGEEGNALKAELARRFREGIDVDKDLIEAEYWEGQIELPGKNTVSDVPVPEVDSELIAPPTSLDYENMNTKELYRAYRAGDPWATYHLALQMQKNGEPKHALAEFEQLTTSIEQEQLNESNLHLLQLSKLQMGRLYEELKETPDSMKKALACYEESALELGCTEAVPDLLRFYTARDITAHEKQILPLLHKLEEGSVEDRMFVAELYRQMGRNVFTIAIYQEILEEEDLTLDTKITITQRLADLNTITPSELQYRSENGDAIATFILAKMKLQENAFDDALQLYALSSEQNPSLLNCASAEADKTREKKNHLLEQIRLEEEARKQAAEAQQLWDAQQLQAEILRKKEERQRRIGWKSPLVFWTITLVASFFFSIALAHLCGHSILTAISNALNAESAMYSFFADLFLPQYAIGSFPLGGVLGSCIYNIFPTRKKMYLPKNYFFSVLMCPLGIVALYFILILLFASILILVIGILIALFFFGFSSGNKR